MKIKIVAWSEEYYYDFLEIKKEEKVIYSGEYIALLSTDDKNFRLNLNYGIREKSSSIILKKFCDGFYSVPDSNCMYLYDYKYEILEMNRYLLGIILFNIEELDNIEEINVVDIINNWILGSNYKGYYLNIKDYIFYLIKEIYFIDNEELNKDIKNTMSNIINIKKKNIINIKYLDLETINFYLNNGQVWEALLKNKKNGDIYLNTKYSISIKIN